MTVSARHSDTTTIERDVAIVGAGFAGMYMLHRLRQLGLSAIVLEAGGGVGGTWYWNRYPGARCDIESVQYSYQFSPELQQDWDWSERYATQPEILRYANHVADRFDLRRDIRFNARVASAIFEEGSDRWTVATEDGAAVRARFCVMATGCLSSANRPQFAGLENFRGQRYHTGSWPHEGVDFSGQRVAVIGTGSSAIQSIPVIAQQAAHLTVFQRTANYTIPAHNRPLDPEYKKWVKANYGAIRERAKKMIPGIDFRINDKSAIAVSPEERREEFERRWQEGGLLFAAAYNDLILNADSNRTAAAFVRGKIREIVHDPAVAELLAPKNIIGCKRLCVDTGYWATFNRPNVSLVDISETAVEGFTADAVKVAGKEYKADAVVFATGFDAMTGALLRIDIRGRDGLSLREKWTDGPRTYLGLGMAGFPNLFTVTGPGSPSVLTNMLPSIEQHVEWIADCIRDVDGMGRRSIEATPAAEEAWVAHNREVAGLTLRSTCSSWYVGANIAGKPRIFMPYVGGFPAYVEKCEDVVRKGYEGFEVR